MTQLIDLGKLRFYFAGTWSSSQEYELNDIVKYGGNVYVYTHALATTGNLPTNTAYWQFVVGGIDFKGTYSGSTAYKVGEAVSHGAIVYQCIANTTGNTPPNALYWTKIAEGVQYEGVYAAETQYQKNDIVFYGGAAYIALADTLGNTPNYSANTAYWGKLVNSAYPDTTNHNLAVLQTDGTNVTWADTPSLNELAIVGDLNVDTKLYVGPDAADFETNAGLTSAQAVFKINSDGDPYGQISVHNIDPQASTDVIVYSNNGVDASGWIDMGITGSAFQQAEFGITGPNDGYIFMEAPEVLTATITNKALTDDVATITTSAAHGFSIGQAVTITGIDSVFNGNYVITGVTSTTFTYAKDSANVAASSATGTATVGTTGAGNLVIATGDKGTENKIILAAGGFADGTTQMEITPGENIHIEIPTPSTSATTGALTVVGGVGISGDMNIAGDVAIVGNLTFGGGSTQAEALQVTSPIIFAGTGNQADTYDLGLVGEYATTVSPIAATVSNKALTNNVATITTAAAHTYLAGDVVTIASVGAPFDGVYSIVAVPTSTTFTYAKTNANVTSASATGTATVNARRKYAGIVRDASDSGKIKAFKDATTTPGNAVNFAEAGASLADLQVAGLTGTSLSVSGASTLTGNTTVGGTLGVTGLTTLTGGLTTSGTARITGRFDVQELREDVVTASVNVANNTMSADYTAANIFYNGTAAPANYTLNLTNVPVDDGKTFSVSVIQVQGAAGSSFIPSAIQIDGVAVSPALKWVGGTAPTPTATSGKIDIFTFTFIRVSSAWTVLGAASLNY
jgi:hypothetical protein